MSYAPADLVLKAVQELEAHGHPISVVSIPALLRKAHSLGLNPTTDPVPFGSSDESDVLNTYFGLPRPPFAGRPFRSVWQVREANPEEKWQKPKYSGGSLQRMRTGVNGLAVFEQIKGAGGDTWRIKPAAGAAMLGWDRCEPVRLVDLALWYGRDRDVADIDALIDWFEAEFAPNVGDLVGTIYLTEVPADYTTHAFGDVRLDESDFFQRMGSLPEAVTVSGTLTELVTRIEDTIREQKFHLPDGLVAQVMSAWLAGDIVVLVGQPGTGKTRFADLIATALSDELDLETPLLVPIQGDFDEGEFLGYEKLDGTPQLRPFATEVLQTDNPLQPRVIKLEEFNLALVESYLSSVLVALQEPSRNVHLPGGQTGTLPVDALIIATCNSFRDEPETRTRLSSPTKRRSVVITMRNVLVDTINEAGGTGADAFPDVIATLALERISEEVRRVDARAADGQATTLDRLRREQLAVRTDISGFSEKARQVIAAIVRTILDTPEGRSWFTYGILRDTALAVGIADQYEAAELRALLGIVGSKLFHQLRGPVSNAETLAAALAGVDGVEQIDDLLDQLKRGSTDEIRPLV